MKLGQLSLPTQRMSYPVFQDGLVVLFLLLVGLFCEVKVLVFGGG